MDWPSTAILCDEKGSHKVTYDVSADAGVISYYFVDKDEGSDNLVGTFSLNNSVEVVEIATDQIVELRGDQGKKLRFEASDSDHLVNLKKSLELLKPDSKALSPSQSNAADEFFDAEEGENPLDLPKSYICPLKNTSDYDIEFGVESEADVESDTSVIVHLLKQISFGMDLTSITLPTFILERRSLLEMFADFFSHPNILIQIPTVSCPKERFTLIVKWYLSSFHAGRNSQVAKKPYNPILGEVFKCFYALTSEEDETSEYVTDGPVSWAKRGNVAFIAEQVSHHPPISAFYAENYEKRICFNSYIYTKSKFLGTSVAAQMVGKGVLKLIDLNEEYSMTYPTGYGRSILTKPKFEMGGQCVVKCEQTGYSATVDFLEKPYVGGKMHQIKAKLMDPKNKSFLTITGEWNGIMYSAEGKSKDKTVFYNTKTEPTYRKYVKKEMDEYESRRLWKKVTECLKANDINGATAEKTHLENKQRQEAKERLANKAIWSPKYFIQDESGSSWQFKTPLDKRLSN